jgi:hypothetical protein
MSDSGGAQAAANINSNLMKAYGAAGVPAVKGVLDYASSSLGQPLPSYVNQVYEGAASGVRQTIMSQLGRSAAGGATRLGEGSGSGLSSLASIAESGGEAYGRERTSVGTSKAVAELEQRNKLLNVMSGGGATATQLGGAFGSVANQGLAISTQPNPGIGVSFGAIAAGLRMYGQSQSNPSSLGPSPYQFMQQNPGFNWNAPGGGSEGP